MDLTKEKCGPCEGGVKPYDAEHIKARLADLTTPWEVSEGKRIKRVFEFKDFKEAMFFVNAVAYIAEGEGHHPDIALFWNRVDLSLWTHEIGGLSINDFIMARKIEALLP